MLGEGILTLSFAPRDSHKAQIQFALERGIPAFVAMLGTLRLPFPGFSFDLLHCSRCLIPFTAYSESSSPQWFTIYHYPTEISIITTSYFSHITLVTLQMPLIFLKLIGYFAQEAT